MKQIQIPSGMRDLLPQECYSKEMMKRKISDVFCSYGYLPIETPLIEFYSTYQNTFTSLREETLYKFVDESGQILALRTDMTLPIGRVCASKYANEEPPFRFSYCSGVYKVRQNFAGKRNEVTDCGIELIGLDSSSDVEVLCCALDVMESLGLKDYTLEIGNSDFFKKACEEAKISGEDTRILADLIDRKEIPALHRKCAAMQISEEQALFFASLPLSGGPDALEEAYSCSFSESLREQISSLLKLRDTLCDLGYGEKITFDLGKVPHLDYYTGIIFEGYVSGIGTGILSGGRYDALLKKLGRDLPAIGFGVKLDYLLDVLPLELPKTRKLYYPADRQAEAMKLARRLRKDGPVELIPSDRTEMEVTE